MIYNNIMNKPICLLFVNGDDGLLGDQGANKIPYGRN
jgi:hypothetical protein